jgi:hypothetical protein
VGDKHVCQFCLNERLHPADEWVNHYILAISFHANNHLGLHAMFKFTSQNANIIHKMGPRLIWLTQEYCVLLQNIPVLRNFPALFFEIWIQ